MIRELKERKVLLVVLIAFLLVALFVSARCSDAAMSIEDLKDYKWHIEEAKGRIPELTEEYIAGLIKSGDFIAGALFGQFMSNYHDTIYQTTEDEKESVRSDFARGNYGSIASYAIMKYRMQNKENYKEFLGLLDAADKYYRETGPEPSTVPVQKINPSPQKGKTASPTPIGSDSTLTLEKAKSMTDQLNNDLEGVINNAPEKIIGWMLSGEYVPAAFVAQYMENLMLDIVWGSTNDFDRKENRLSAQKYGQLKKESIMYHLQGKSGNERNKFLEYLADLDRYYQKTPTRFRTRVEKAKAQKQ